MTRVRIDLGIVMMLVSLLALLGTSRVAAEDLADLTAQARIEAGQVIVEGSLSSDGQPVRNVRIFVQVDEEPTYYIDADNQGAFGIHVPAPANAAAVTVWFEGRGNVAATTWEIPLDSGTSARLEPAVSPSGEPSTQPSPSPTPSQEHAPVSVQVELSTSESRPGGLIEATGSVSSAAGQPITDMQVDAMFGDAVLEYSTTFTDAQGKFTTFIEIPADAAVGAAQLALVTPEVGEFAAGKQVLEVTIKEPPSPQAHATPTAGPVSSPAALPEADDASGPPADAPGEEVSGASLAPTGLEWVLVGVVIVGGMSLLVGMFILYRSISDRRRQHEDTVIGEEGLLASHFDVEDPAG